MKTIISCCLLASLLVLNGCASIVSSSFHEVSVLSEPSQVTFEVINTSNQSTTLVASTPYRLNLDASGGYFRSAEYLLRFSKAGYLPIEIPLKTGLNGWYLGNIVTSGPIGLLIVDPATGAMWRFKDETLKVMMYRDTLEGRRAMAHAIYNGRSALDARNYEQVIAETSKGTILDPGFLEGYLHRCAAYEALGDQLKAEQDFQRILALELSNAADLQARAFFLADRGRLKPALNDLTAALTYTPDNATVLLGRGQLYLKMQQPEKARIDIEAACRNGEAKACDIKFADAP